MENGKSFLVYPRKRPGGGLRYTGWSVSQRVLGWNAHSGDGICFHALLFWGKKMCLSEMQMLEQSCSDCEKETPLSQKINWTFFFMAVLASQQEWGEGAEIKRGCFRNQHSTVQQSSSNYRKKKQVSKRETLCQSPFRLQRYSPGQHRVPHTDFICGRQRLKKLTGSVGLPHRPRKASLFIISGFIMKQGQLQYF